MIVPRSNSMYVDTRRFWYSAIVGRTILYQVSLVVHVNACGASGTIDRMSSLSRSELASFEERGYLVRRALFSPARAAELSRETEAAPREDGAARPRQTCISRGKQTSAPARCPGSAS